MKSTSRLRPATCGRTNSAASLRYRFGFSPLFDSCLSDRRKPIIPLSCLIDDIVYDSVFFGLLRVHNEVALHVFFHFVQFLPAVLVESLLRNVSHTKSLPG